jgi:hypothetical protein
MDLPSSACSADELEAVFECSMRVVIDRRRWRTRVQAMDFEKN